MAEARHKLLITTQIREKKTYLDNTFSTLMPSQVITHYMWETMQLNVTQHEGCNIVYLDIYDINTCIIISAVSLNKDIIST